MAMLGTPATILSLLWSINVVQIAYWIVLVEMFNDCVFNGSMLLTFVLRTKKQSKLPKNPRSIESDVDRTTDQRKNHGGGFREIENRSQSESSLAHRQKRHELQNVSSYVESLH